jgi:hypothetical protein
MTRSAKIGSGCRTRAWLVLTMSSALACSVGLSFVWPVSLTALAVALDPIWVSRLRRQMGDDWPRSALLGWLLRTANPAAQSVREEQRADWVAAVSLVPGLLVASLCALALPIAPFQHGRLVAIAVLATWLAWLATGALTIVLARGLLLAAIRWRSPAYVGFAAAATLVAFALFQGAHRSSPDLYWNSLIPVFDSRVERPLGENATRQLKPTSSACDRDPRHNGALLASCRYSVDEQLCIGISDFSDICLDCIVADASLRCPDLEIRREPHCDRMIMARRERTTIDARENSYYPGLLFGTSSAYVVELDWKKRVADLNDTNQGALATSIALRDAVAAPWPWLLLAGGGTVFVGYELYRRRRPAQSTNANPTSNARNAYSDQEGLWCSWVLVLLALVGPTAVAIGMGVGR